LGPDGADHSQLHACKTFLVEAGAVVVASSSQAVCGSTADCEVDVYGGVAGEGNVDTGVYVGEDWFMNALVLCSTILKRELRYHRFGHFQPTGR
jgi:hypothetical protein